MAIYVYRCESCKYEFEVWQNINDAPLTTCHNCKGNLIKVFFPTPVIFKGSGFYTTDSRKNNQIEPKEMGSEKKQSDNKSMKEPTS